MAKRGRRTKPRQTELGKKLEQLRLGRDWTVTRLAKEAGVPYKTLSKIECGTLTPTRPGVLLKLAKALDTHPDYLLLPAALTRYLAPLPSIKALPVHEPYTLLVSESEFAEVEKYLQFIRYIVAVEELKA